MLQTNATVVQIKNTEVQPQELRYTHSMSRVSVCTMQVSLVQPNFDFPCFEKNFIVMLFFLLLSPYVFLL